MSPGGRRGATSFARADTRRVPAGRRRVLSVATDILPGEVPDETPDPPSPAPADDERPAPSPARPAQPKLGRRSAAGPTSRPVRPASQRTRTITLPAVEEPPSEPVIAETVIVAPPPEPPPVEPARPRRPLLGTSGFESAAFRRTLTPPCLVMGVGLTGLGIAYFLQAPDAALREVPPVAAGVLISVGLLLLACGGGLARSTRRIDSPRADS